MTMINTKHDPVIFASAPVKSAMPEKGAKLDASAAESIVGPDGETIMLASVTEAFADTFAPETALEEGFADAPKASLADRLVGAKTNLKHVAMVARSEQSDIRGINKTALENVVLKPVESEGETIGSYFNSQKTQNLAMSRMLYKRNKMMKTFGEYTFAITPGKGPRFVNRNLSKAAVSTAKFLEKKVAPIISSAPQVRIPENKIGSIAAKGFNMLSMLSGKVAKQTQDKVRGALLPVLGRLFSVIRMPNVGRVLTDVIASTFAAVARVVTVVGAVVLPFAAVAGAAFGIVTAVMAFPVITGIALGALATIGVLAAGGKFVYDKLKSRGRAAEEQRDLMATLTQAVRDLTAEVSGLKDNVSVLTAKNAHIELILKKRSGSQTTMSTTASVLSWLNPLSYLSASKGENTLQLSLADMVM
ncbi:MAG: hypothetical protein KR126chlam1_00412 [Chlamydiae bacterium]|nr:hypothetical protein [Chlamydiota bacterium]